MNWRMPFDVKELILNRFSAGWKVARTPRFVKHRPRGNAQKADSQTRKCEQVYNNARTSLSKSSLQRSWNRSVMISFDGQSSRMDSQEYYYRYSKSNVVRIAPSPRELTGWGVWLNDQLLCGNFPSADDAAFCASKNDFPTELAMQRFRPISVPADLNRWRTTPPELPIPLATHNVPTPPSDCKSRHRRFGANPIRE